LKIKTKNLVRLRLGVQLSVALTAGLMAILALPAQAGTIGISGGKLIVGTEAGDGSQLFDPTIVGANLVLSNLDFDIVTPGCTGGASITCPLTGFQELVILGGNGDDVITLAGITGLNFAITALGGPGNDILVGTPGSVKLFGGPGDDLLIGMAGNCVSPGVGADIVIGGGCNAGPEPTITPLPRTASEAPEPGGGVLILTGLISLGVVGRKKATLRA